MNHDEINCLMVDFLEKLCPAPLQIANTTPFSQFTYGFKQMTEYISKKRDEGISSWQRERSKQGEGGGVQSRIGSQESYVV